MAYIPSQILIDQVTAYLTEQLGRAPTSEEILNGLVSPWVLGNIHNTLNVTTSTLAVAPGDDLQVAIDQVVDNGGGEVHMASGTYTLTDDLRISSNVRLSGTGSGGSIIDCDGTYQIQVIGDDSSTTGTVDITNGTDAVVGTLTVFDPAMIGESMFLNGQWYVIATVTDALNLTIDTLYLGPTLTGADCVIASPNTSAFLQGFTVQNSATDLIQVRYAQNFGGFDILSYDGLSGINMEYVNTCNWSVGFVDSCDSGIMAANMAGMTIKDTFLTNIMGGGGYVCDTVTNSVIINSSLDGVVGNGYDCLNCTNFGIDEVSVLNVTGDGFYLEDSGESFSITNGISGFCSGNGMSLVNCTQMQVATIQFSDNTGFGVSVDATSTDNLFIGGLYASNTAGAFDDNGTGTLVRSNIGTPDN